MRRARVASLRSHIFWSVWVTTTIVVAVSGACLFNTQTTLCESSGRICPAGWTCAAAQDVCIPIGGCGDGVKSPDEVCDDGNILPGDSCSPDCQADKPCGDGVVDPGEQCDTGSVDSETCNSDCTAVKCGDRHTNRAAGEECDNGGLDTSDCNGKTCKFPRCGDRYYNPDFTLPVIGQKEQCDSGGVNTPACDSDCTVPLCGDGHHNPEYAIPGASYREQCDPGIMLAGIPQDSSNCDSDCTAIVCGDKHINEAAGEECDDGNNVTTDACPLKGPGGCKKAVCGDGFIRENVEDCDPGHMNSMGMALDGPTCDSDCTPVRCGDLHINLLAGEQCDDANINDHDSCPEGNLSGGCKSARCGDGYIWNQGGGTEVCDPGGNGKPGVGCNAGLQCRSDCAACIPI